MTPSKRFSEYFKFNIQTIVLFAAVIRVIILIMAHPWSNPLFLDDDQAYAKMGEFILDNLSFNYTGLTEAYSSMRTPGYPLFISLIYLIFGKTLWMIPAVQVLIDTATVVIVYFISEELFKTKQISLISAVLYSINFPSIFFSQLIMTDVFFVFSFSLFFLVFIRAIRRNCLSGFAISGILLGLCANIRPLVLYFPIIILLVIIPLKIGNTRKIISFSVFLITFILVLLPWHFRNLNAYGHFKMTSQSGYSVYNFNVLIVEADMYNKSRNDIKKEHMTKIDSVSNPFDQSKIFEKSALDFLFDHPFEYGKHHILGMLKMFLSSSKSFFLKLFNIDYQENSDSPKSITERVIENIYSPEQLFLTPILISVNLLIYLMALYGIYRIWRDKRNEVLLLIITIIYFVNITGVIGGLRYRLPIIPFYLILTAAGIHHILKYKRRNNLSNLV